MSTHRVTTWGKVEGWLRGLPRRLELEGVEEEEEVEEDEVEEEAAEADADVLRGRWGHIAFEAARCCIAACCTIGGCPLGAG